MRTVAATTVEAAALLAFIVAGFSLATWAGWTVVGAALGVVGWAIENRGDT